MTQRRTLSKIGTFVAGGLALVAAGTTLLHNSPLNNGDNNVTATSAESHVTGDVGDMVTHIGDAEIDPNIQAGDIEYLPLDELGRATGVKANLTYDNRAQAKAWGRGNNPESDDSKPSGWSDHNEKVTVNWGDGSTYHGYFWNRSHLLADSLGGKAATDNWITGTRAQNVGKNNGQGGMAYAETRARNYLDNEHANACPLYYAATPVYQDNALIPLSVTVDIHSCDGELNERVSVDNSMPGFGINYNTGEFIPLEEGHN